MVQKRIGSWLAALVMAVVLACGFAVPSEAAESIPVDAKGAITLTNIEEGAQVHAYKIASASWDGKQPVEPAFTWETSVANWLNTQDAYKGYVGNSNAVTEDYAKADSAFFDKLAAAVKDGTVRLTAVPEVEGAGDDKVTTIENLAMGSYLVLVDNSPKYVYQPIADNVIPVYNETDKAWELKQPTVNPDTANPVKRSELTIEKTVGGKEIVGAQYGDVLDFDLVSPVPTYPANAIDKLYGISDTMDPTKGLTFVDGSVKVYGLQSKDQAIKDATDLTGTDAYTQDKVDSSKPNAKAVSFGLHFDYSKITSYSYIKVTYQATVNSNAKLVEGVDNTAKLEWSNDPYTNDGYAEIPDKVKVYPYGLDVLKVDSKDQSKKLAGAEFTLAPEGGSALQFVDEGNGTYHVFDNKVDENKPTTGTLVTNNEGKLVVNGLNKDVTYVLTETKAPAGYVKPSNTIEFTIKDENNDGLVDKNADGATNGTTAYYQTTVPNDKGFDLPTTGGPGTIALTAAGVVLMGGAAVLIARGRKQN